MTTTALLGSDEDEEPGEEETLDDIIDRYASGR